MEIHERRILLTVCLLAVLFLGAAGASAQFYSFTLSTGDLALTVPPAGSIGTRNVSLTMPLVGLITDVNLRMRMNHTFVGDLHIFLIHPDGTRISLIDNRGGGGDNLGSGATTCAGTPTVFDDEAVTLISAGAPPFAGSYDPEQPLSGLDGKLAYGDWIVEINDQVGGDSGTLYCVILEVVAQASPHQLIDVDGNGTAAPLSDGLLMVRWTFGLTGAQLISGVVGQGCTRCTAPQIEAYLKSLDD